jgi:hypothetical protein
LVLDQRKLPMDELMGAVRKVYPAAKSSTVSTIRSDARDTLKVLIEMGKLDALVMKL